MVIVQAHWIFFLVTFGLVAAYFAGRRHSLSAFKRVVGTQMKGRYLGDVLQDEGERHAIATAYFEPEKANREMNAYPWDAPCIPTPYVGYAPAPSDNPRLSVNSLQLRAKAEVEMPKPTGRLRIFLLGGSVAFSAGAPGPESTIGGYLETALNEMLGDTGKKAEVFTAAATAWASTHERIVLENRISELEPDVVICLSGYNDVHWAWNSEDVLWFRAYYERHFLQVVESAYLAAGATLPAGAPPSGKVPDTSEVVRILLKNVGLALHALPVDTKYVFALQPFIHACGKELTHRETAFLQRWHPAQTAYYLDCYQGFREALSNLVEAGAFRFIDLTGAFSANSKEEIFLDSSHFGDRGNAILARRLANDLAALVMEKAKVRAVPYA